MSADGWSIYAAGGLAAFQGHLLRPVKAMTDKIPVYKISAVIDGNGGEKFESRGYEVKIFSIPADTWVRVKAGDDGILVVVHRILLFCYIK
jgi:hypothetical protein